MVKRIRDNIVYTEGIPTDVASYESGNLKPMRFVRAIIDTNTNMVVGLIGHDRDVLADIGLEPDDVKITGGSIDNTVQSNTTVDDFILFTTSSNPAYTEGRLFYDYAAHTLCYYNENSQVTVNVAQEQLVRVRNQSGSTIADGSVVYVSGATGQTPTITLSIATSEPSSRIIGVSTSTISNNGFGYVTVQGVVNGIDTSDFDDGDAVYLSATVAGDYVANSPVSPNFSVQVGIVLYSHAVNGKLLVAPQYLSTKVANIVGTISQSQITPFSSAWNSSHLVMGVYHLWIDSSGRLRIKSSSPASDTDGSIIGPLI